jgi:CRISPR-associated protein Cas2
MWIIVTYDVSTETPRGRSRLRRVAKVCKNYGQRVQKSVFECQVSDTTHIKLRSELLKAINKDEDSLRIYRLVEPRERYVEEYGQTRTVFFDDPLVV